MIRRELWHVVVPWKRTLKTPGGEHGASYALLVRLREAGGREGLGYAYAMSARVIDRIAEAAHRLAPRDDCTLAQLLDVERLDDRSPACNRASRAAASALSTAAWDLLGKRSGRSCADLWGKCAGRDAIDAYASGLFLGGSADDLMREAREYRAQGFRRVKMRGGRSSSEDLACYAAVCSAFADQRSVAVDFVFKSDASSVNDFVAAAVSPPMWIEDPVAYEHLGAIQAIELVAGGEACRTTAELMRMHDAGVGQAILDLQVLGGPLRFLEAARVLNALGCRVGSHTFAHESPHLLATLPASMPVEVLDWWNALYEEPVRPDDQGRLAVRGPGFGFTLREETLAAHGKKL